ncbi:hypothetical protein N0V88_008006 [Collariella sp. IMI 366227]|nr:hypothetical protein N0V88_008006 [Collariella sp. IMI 366227]
MKFSNAATLLSTAALVHGHGYFTVPFSRSRLAFEAGIDTCPECSILEPVAAWPDPSSAKVGRSGPCGYNQRVSKDYNSPGDSWGKAPVATYSPGQVIDVEWCVDHNGDHGGIFSFRICQDQALVDKFLTPGYIPTEAEKQEAEACFDKGILPCTDVPGQTCGFNPDCSQGQPCWRNDWFTCNAYQAGDRRSCQGVDNAPLNSCKTTIGGGFKVTKKIKLPNYSSKHTLLSWKWNSFQTPQVYLSCADIAISGGGGGGETPQSSAAPSSAAPQSSAPPQSSAVQSSAAASTLSTSTKAAEPSATCVPVSSVAVTFKAKVESSAGLTVKIAGGISELGNWSAAAAPALTAPGCQTTDGAWTYTAKLPAGKTFQYKFVKISKDGKVVWESDPQRSYTVPKCDETAVVETSWK